MENTAYDEEGNEIVEGNYFDHNEAGERFGWLQRTIVYSVALSFGGWILKDPVLALGNGVVAFMNQPEILNFLCSNRWLFVCVGIAVTIAACMPVIGYASIQFAKAAVIRSKTEMHSVEYVDDDDDDSDPDGAGSRKEAPDDPGPAIDKTGRKILGAFLQKPRWTHAELYSNILKRNTKTAVLKTVMDNFENLGVIRKTEGDPPSTGGVSPTLYVANGTEKILSLLEGVQ